VGAHVKKSGGHGTTMLKIDKNLRGWDELSERILEDHFYKGVIKRYKIK
jgi:hypothetical protein